MVDENNEDKENKGREEIIENLEDNRDKKELKKTIIDGKNKDIKKFKDGEPNLVDRIRKNPWIAATSVLIILALIFFINGFTEGSGNAITGNVVSENNMNNLALNFFNNVLAQGQGNAVIDSISKESGLYKIIFSNEGQKASLYFTLDGKWIQQGSELVSIINVSEASAGNPTQDSQQEGDQEPNWSVFENELESEIKSKILSFNKEVSSVYNESLRINVLENYDLIPNSLIVFYHGGCGWCTRYYPVLVEAQVKYPDLNIYALVLGENEDIAEKYGASGTPASVINGKYFVSGYRSIEDLSEILDKLN